MSQKTSPSRLKKLLDNLDEFIEKTLKPIEESEDESDSGLILDF